MEIAKGELDELMERATPLWIKIELPDETILLEAKRLAFVTLKHTVKTDDGQPFNSIHGGDVVLIDGLKTQSDPKNWPPYIYRALEQAKL